MIDQGNPLPNGTDSRESCNPFLSMYCAVTRKDEHLKPEGGWHPQEAMTREEALRSYTNWAAYAAFEEQLKGSIEPGKLADFVVIDRDYMKCPEEEIKDICSCRQLLAEKSYMKQSKGESGMEKTKEEKKGCFSGLLMVLRLLVINCRIHFICLRS